MPMSRRTLLSLAAAGAAGTAAPPDGPGAATTDAADPLGVRRDFPVTSEAGAYLDTAYIGPVPRVVAEAAAAFAEAKAVRPISLPDMQAKADDVRGQFARLVGASAMEIGFLPATSDGENLVAHALELKAG